MEGANDEGQYSRGAGWLTAVKQVEHHTREELGTSL